MKTLEIRNLTNWTRGAVCFGAAVLVSQPALANLYDVDFGSPPHVVGAAPTTGGGPATRDTVSSIIFGEPTVELSLGAMIDQPLVFDSADSTSTDQINFELSDLPASSFYRFQADVLVERIEGTSEFTVLFDTPEIRRIDFGANGDVSIFIPFITPTSVPIGTYAVGSIVHLQVDVDLNNDTWTIYLDGDVVHAGPFGGAVGVDGIRVTNPTFPDGDTLVGLDNVIIADSVSISPEHFACYSVVRESSEPLPSSPTVSLVDQFLKQDEVRVGRIPQFLCAPVDKNGEGVENETDHLACYRARTGNPDTKVIISNQFGEQVVAVGQGRLLCVPSKKARLPQ